MNYFGLDYGTTTSLLYAYDNVRISSLLSAVKSVNGEIIALGKNALNTSDTSGVVESPKRGINNLESTTSGGVTYKEMIEALMCEMLKTLKQNMSQEDLRNESHITLTVPNSYGAANYISMYQMLDNCLKKIFGESYNVKIHLLPEPVSAALFYVQRHLAELPQTSHLVVCDIGGGTTDICIIECNKEADKLNFSVLKNSIEQSDEIGGNKFDDELKKCIDFPTGFNSVNKKILCQILKCELSKLSEHESASVPVGPQVISCTRSAFERAIKGHLDKLSEMLDSILKKTDLKVDESWYILPIGGSCKIPAIQKRLELAFPGAQQTANDETTIFDSVAQGAAIYSAWCGRAMNIGGFHHINIENRTPHEYQFYSYYGTWETLVPENACDGLYPQNGIQPNIKPTKAYINVERGKYTLGEITLREKEANAQPIKREHTMPFSLDGRRMEDIELQLGVEIKNCVIARWWLTDCKTGEKQEWTY